MSAEQETTGSAQQQRPGLKDGVVSEFTIIAPIKPGHADKLREFFAAMMGEEKRGQTEAALRDIGTLHNARHAIFDNDKYHLFASVFDGDWDTYLDDFATTSVADNFDAVYTHMEGFPGVKDPNVKEWFAAHQVTAYSFNSAYRDLTLQQIWKDQRVNEAFQEVLDTPEFRAALENPANAELLATPAFQKLLNEAQG